MKPDIQPAIHLQVKALPDLEHPGPRQPILPLVVGVLFPPCMRTLGLLCCFDLAIATEIKMEQVQEFLNQYGVIVGGVAAIIGLAWYFTKSSSGEGKMRKSEYILTMREQKQKERNLIADEVASLLLKLYSNGTITEERYRYWHLRFGTQLGLKDLLPVKKLGPADIKKAVKARLAKKELIYKTVPFFKETKKEKPKNVIDGILKNIKAA